MNSMNKADLEATLRSFGETVPASWGKFEMKVRLLELQEETGVEIKPKAVKTPLQQTLQKLTALKKKQELSEYCQQVLKIPVGSNDTVSQIHKRALAAIYQQTEPWGQDPVGFGKFSDLTYQQVRDEKGEYKKWILQTNRESPEADHRLRRLAKWLESHPEADQEGETSRPSIGTKGRGKGKAATSTAEANENLIKQMAETIQALRAELNELRDDRNLRRRNNETSESQE
jgi:hypothetical protein